MRSFIVFLFVAAFSLALLAADTFTPLNVKEGLWEVTTTHSMSGMPSIPPEALAKMTPEQRAHLEQMMKDRSNGTPSTKVTKSCVTKEKLNKSMAFEEQREDCKRDIVRSSSSHLEVKFHCENSKGGAQKFVSDGTFVVDVSGSDSAKGTVHIVASGGGHNMNMDSTFTSKYIGPTCGDVQ